MQPIPRRNFIIQAGILGLHLSILSSCNFNSKNETTGPGNGVDLIPSQDGEDIFAYLQRTKGSFDLTTYRQIIGAANEFKEGDQALGTNCGKQRIQGPGPAIAEPNQDWPTECPQPLSGRTLRSYSLHNRE